MIHLCITQCTYTGRPCYYYNFLNLSYKAYKDSLRSLDWYTCSSRNPDFLSTGLLSPCSQVETGREATKLYAFYLMRYSLLSCIGYKSVRPQKAPHAPVYGSISVPHGWCLFKILEFHSTRINSKATTIICSALLEAVWTEYGVMIGFH